MYALNFLKKNLLTFKVLNIDQSQNLIAELLQELFQNLLSKLSFGESFE